MLKLNKVSTWMRATAMAATLAVSSMVGASSALAPPFALASRSGEVVSLDKLKGQVVMLNFWASWCIPCRAEMPALEELAAAENDDSFMVLPINLDLGEGGLEKAKAFLNEGQWPHLPLYADSTFESFKQLQTSAVALGLPSTLLIDKNGCELAVLQGPAEWHSQDGRNVIAALKSL